MVGISGGTVVGAVERVRDSRLSVSERCEAAAELLDDSAGALAPEDFDARRRALDFAREEGTHWSFVPGLLDFVVAGLGRVRRERVADSISIAEWEALAAIEAKMYAGVEGIFAYTDVMPFDASDPIASLWRQCREAVEGAADDGDDLLPSIARRVAAAQAVIAFGPDLAFDLAAKVVQA